MSLMYPALSLLNKMFMTVDTASELCQKGDCFPEKKDKSHFCLCSGIYVYLR